MQRERSRAALLIASLVLNVFLAGAVGGGVYRWWAHTRDAAGGPQHGLRFAVEGLSEARRAQFRSALQQTRHDSQALIEGGRAGRGDVIRALSATPFDQAALDEALARTRTADSGLRARLEQAVAVFSADLSPAERLKLIDAMERRGPLHRSVKAIAP